MIVFFHTLIAWSQLWPIVALPPVSDPTKPILYVYAEEAAPPAAEEAAPPAAEEAAPPAAEEAAPPAAEEAAPPAAEEAAPPLVHAETTTAIAAATASNRTLFTTFLLVNLNLPDTLICWPWYLLALVLSCVSQRNGG